MSHLLAPWLDRELADGTPSWSSPTHAARSLELTRTQHRRSVARSLERLVADAEKPRMRLLSAAVPPCREQVRDALPVLLTVAAWLRSAEPVGCQGIARLRRLLCDGSGPCYARIELAALTIELESVNRLLDAPN